VIRLAPLLALLAALATTAAPSVADTIEAPAGSLLVAAPELGDPNFDHTVVLLLNHDDDGALGVVINRPYGKAPTDELLRKLGQDPGGITGQTELFYGGPVQAEIGMVVHTTDYARATTRPVAKGIAVTSDPAVLADVARGKGPAQAIPVLGYAGWGPGQLESEIAQGAWFTLPADPDLIFAADSSQIWAAAYARRGVDL